jgi:hypothetical protein
LALAAAVLLSTNAPKLSLACDGSDLPDLCEATGKDGLADTSDVTLTTGGPLAMKLSLKVSKDRATPEPQKISIYFNYLAVRGRLRSGPGRFPFLPSGKICRLRRKGRASFASREYGLY